MKQNIRISKYIQFNYLCDKLEWNTFQRIQKIKQISQNRTKVYQGLTDDELNSLIDELNDIASKKTGKDEKQIFESMNQMRRKIFATLKDLFGCSSTADVDNWLLKKGTHKVKLNEMNYNQLKETCDQMDAINKSEHELENVKPLTTQSRRKMKVVKGGEEE